ncbi:MAG: cobaltochelatase subunit CobN [Vicinamibacterales bacterium]
MRRLLCALFALLAVLVAPSMAAGPKVTLLSTEFVLERKFQEMQKAATAAGVNVVYVHVDHATPDTVRRAVEGAALVIVDTPRAEDQAAVEKAAGGLLRERSVPTMNVMTMSPPRTRYGVGISAEQTETLFKYYTNGTSANYARMFRYITRGILKSERGEILPPIELPDQGIWHPRSEEVFSSLDAYIAWLERAGHRVSGDRKPPIIGVEISSSFIADGQTRMMEDLSTRIERAGGVPLMFYRGSRSGRPSYVGGAAPSGGAPPASLAALDASSLSSSAATGGPPPGVAGGAPASAAGAAAGRGGRGGGRGGAGGPQAPPTTSVSGRPVAAQFGVGASIPVTPTTPSIDTLIIRDGKPFVDVILNTMFIGSDPEGRKKEAEQLGLPIMQTLSYRDGDHDAYLRDTAGVPSFSLPYSLTTAEYVGMMDPMMLDSNEHGEMVTMPEQADAIVGKAINLVHLQRTPNAEKKVALFFWNHPPGEKNQGASNLNVPRSIVALSQRMKTAGYTIRDVTEDDVTDAVAAMQRPAYRKGVLAELAMSRNAAFLPLATYKKWFATLPVAKQKEIVDFWGAPEKSPWVIKRAGEPAFVIPRYEVGNLLVMPQPMRGETANEDEKKLYHDTKIPLNHFYMATYLWVRERFRTDAIVHFGTHGTQEWTPGKERGLWVYDDPLILIGNTPIIYPYIVDNISEAVHVKRRGRGVIVSHQTPPFAPAGLTEDLLVINDRLREFESSEDGLVKENAKKAVLEQVEKLHMHDDLKWSLEDARARFVEFLEPLHEYLEDLGATAQPLGLHTLGSPASDEHIASTVMQMLGAPLYERLGVKDAKTAFAGDYRQLKETRPYQFVAKYTTLDAVVEEPDDPGLKELARQARTFAANLRTMQEIDHVLDGLAARFIETSYGGDPIRNPDTLPTGRNMYGFDPSRVPTTTAYESGKEAVEALIAEYRKVHGGRYPEKLTFSVWSTETMRHLGMLEAEIFYAIGVKPVWDRGGRVIDMEVIPQRELKRPRIDVVVSITGLYRDQFPNVMERINEGLVKVAALDEPDNFIRRNTRTVKAALVTRGVADEQAEEFAMTRIFGNESGDYGTKLPEATLASDTWEGDEKLASLYLSRMSWAYGPNPKHWSQKLQDGTGGELNVYAEQLRGTSAAVFSRSSNLRGLLDTDHPFEYLGGISLAVRSIDGASPQLYISNMRDPARARLETAEKFLATDLRTVYQHPNWVAEMKKEGYSGTLEMLDAVNNFWGWNAVDKNVVREDQWQEFHDIYVKDKFDLGLRQWFEAENPSALASISERMLEAVRKGAWQPGEETVQSLVETYTDLANRFDVVSTNSTFTKYVQTLAVGYGMSLGTGARQSAAAPSGTALSRPRTSAATPAPRPTVPPAAAAPPAPRVRGQALKPVSVSEAVTVVLWRYGFLILFVVGLGLGWQLFREQGLSLSGGGPFDHAA